MSALQLVNRLVVLPSVGFGLGMATFLKAWPDEGGSITLKDEDTNRVQRKEILQKIETLGLYQQLSKDSRYSKALQSEGIPAGHRPNHVGQGILFGEGKLEIDPIILRNAEDGEIVVFYHLGKDLSNENGKIHKGVLSLLLDEALCYCGFPTLPSKRGVTAKLDIQFEKDIPADSTIILKANVTQAKGRKCVIDGTLESFSSNSITNYFLKPTVYAKARCILVEPKWFKYLRRVNVF